MINIYGLDANAVTDLIIRGIDSLLGVGVGSFWDTLVSIFSWNQYLALKFYYLIFAIAYLYRLCKHKSDGIISRKESKPVSFKWKVALQFIMILTTLAMCI
jgi:hypothetical protein